MKPRALRPGDTVRLVSPASPIKPEMLGYMTRLLEGEGYKVQISAHALDQANHLAGSDGDRAMDLQEAFADDDVSCVLCTRGGYGCARLFPYLDLDKIAASEKLFAGFSDITTLHIALNRRGLATLHSPMAMTLHYPREPFVYDSFKRALQGDLSEPAEARRAVTVNPGSAEGETVGGCLCLLTDSLGTPEPLEAVGKILFIEDVDEAPHRVDAMFTHLLNSQILQSAAGIVVGEMTRSDDRIDEGIGGTPWREIVAERIAGLGVPAVLDYPFGHAKDMLTVGLGLKARLNADTGRVTYLEGF
jgi:muramoyltetrapeptide carboxypeptidase